jgi:choline dehydrogenase-like flavoprotein
MFVDARELEGETVLEADVAVVGAGAAGITIARELAPRGISVLLLESGGFEYEEETQALYLGTATGTILGESTGYLTASRLRYFGGSTNHWNGWCRPLDPEDYEERSWRLPSGWPIGPGDLAPYYDRAAPLLGISPFDYDPARAGQYPHLLAGSDAFETVFFHLSPPVRFGQRYRRELEDSARAKVVLHANVLGIETTGDAAHVTGLRCRALGRPPFRARARSYVIAGGGIENARLLLLSDDVQPGGVGNRLDLVGRFFMDHPAVSVGQIALPYRRIPMRTYEQGPVRERGHAIRGVLRATNRLARREELLNALLVLEPRRPEQDIPPLGAEVAWLSTDCIQLTTEVADPEDGTIYFGSLEMSSEQLPNHESRVALSDDLDALGARRTRLDWRFTQDDASSILRTAQWLIRHLGKGLAGRVRLRIDEETVWERTRWSNHHMGTTRMASSPSQGVVDGECRVHGTDNLFVAGSSVFATSGCSNPTFTLVALALRLADRLQRDLATEATG